MEFEFFKEIFLELSIKGKAVLIGDNRYAYHCRSSMREVVVEYDCDPMINGSPFYLVIYDVQYADINYE